jgi:predicted dehydrogenase
MSKLKVGVVGGGHIVTHRHLPVFKKMGVVEVSAICDKNESVAVDVAKRFGIRNSYTDLSQMLKENLDVIDICTPPRTHARLAIQAMEGRCHVLIEKPLAMSVKEADEMISVAQRNSVRLCVVHQNLFNRVVEKARALVESGSLGDLIAVSAGTFLRRDNAMCLNGQHWCHALPGGIFFEILPHPIYLLQLFLRDIQPTCILTGKLGRYSWMALDEVNVLLKSDAGSGSVVASCNSPFHGDTLSISGTKSALQIDLWGRSIIVHGPRAENPFSVGKNNLHLASQFLGLIGTTLVNSSIMVLGGVKVSAHYGFLHSFVQSILDNHELPVKMDEARENVRILQEICSKIQNK